jgi:hypothetical protein
LQLPAVRTTATAATAAWLPAAWLASSGSSTLLLQLLQPSLLRWLLPLAGQQRPLSAALLLHKHADVLLAPLHGSCQLVCTPPKCLQLQELQGQQLLLLGLPVATASSLQQQLLLLLKPTIVCARLTCSCRAAVTRHPNGSCSSWQHCVSPAKALPTCAPATAAKAAACANDEELAVKCTTTAKLCLAL